MENDKQRNRSIFRLEIGQRNFHFTGCLQFVMKSSKLLEFNCSKASDHNCQFHALILPAPNLPCFLFVFSNLPRNAFFVLFSPCTLAPGLPCIIPLLPRISSSFPSPNQSQINFIGFMDFLVDIHKTSSPLWIL